MTRVGTGDGQAWASLPCKGAVPSAPVLRGSAYHAVPLVSWGCSLVHRPVHHTHFSTALPSGFLPSSAPHVEGRPPRPKADRTGAGLLEKAWFSLKSSGRFLITCAASQHTLEMLDHMLFLGKLCQCVKLENRQLTA